MSWNVSGSERVKSYRVYQELEVKFNEAMERIKELERAVAFKDGLIRSLAAEIAMLPKAPTTQDLQHLYEEAADSHARTTGSGMRRIVSPGLYSSAADGTSEEDEPSAPVSSVGPLAHVPSPKRKMKQS